MEPKKVVLLEKEIKILANIYGNDESVVIFFIDNTTLSVPRKLLCICCILLSKSLVAWFFIRHFSRILFTIYK